MGFCLIPGAEISPPGYPRFPLIRWISGRMNLQIWALVNCKNLIGSMKPMTPHDRQLVHWYLIISLNGGKFHFHAPIKATCYSPLVFSEDCPNLDVTSVWNGGLSSILSFTIDHQTHGWEINLKVTSRLKQCCIYLNSMPNQMVNVCICSYMNEKKLWFCFLEHLSFE